MGDGLPRGRLYVAARRIWVAHVRARIASELWRQRLRLTFFAAGYLPLLTMGPLGIGQRMRLLARFLIVDWRVPHSHTPAEIVAIVRAIAERPAAPGECVIEAGCYQGGSTVKLSIVCALFGYTLHVFDSFQGVPRLEGDALRGTYDFSGEYASSLATLRDHLTKYGVASVCREHPGWFSETLIDVPFRTKVALIDCDAATSTAQALGGIIPSLSSDGCVFSQDFQVEPVRRLLFDENTWRAFDRGLPQVTHEIDHLARIQFRSRVAESA